jgi:phosphoadenosine phosphosulfate reductase
MNIDETKSLIREALRNPTPDSMALVTAKNPPAACLTCSFQIEGMVLTHMVREELPDTPLLFIDTGYHFQEVYEYRDRMVAAWNLNLITLLPRQTARAQEAEFGILHQTAPDRCCAMRKVEPLFAALEEYDVWLTGLRREQSPTRGDLQIAETFRLPSGKQLRKISPLALWSTAEVWEYAREYEIPILPLYGRGYTSVGCEPCTSLPTSRSDSRSGRWGGTKLEWGIHGRT